MASTTISSTAVNSDLSDIATALTASVCSDGQTTITGQLKFPSGTAAAPAFTFASDLTTGMYLAGSKQLGFSAGGTAAIILDENNVGSGQNGAQLYYANGAILNPVGMIVDFAGTTAPTGWLLCYGQSVTTASYPELFQIIGYTYGGAGANFTIPDYRGRVGAGKDNMGGSAANRIGSVVTDSGTIVGTTLGSTGGSSTHAQTSTEMATHTHSVTDPGHFHNYDYATTTAGSGSVINQVVAPNTGTPVATRSATTGISNANAGSGTAMAILPPMIIINKIIFAGRP